MQGFGCGGVCWGVSVYANSIILNSFAMRSNYHNPSQSEDSVTKISRSKSRNQMTIANRIKEKQSGWNERFHLEQIPEYNYQNEPHLQYLKNKLRIPNKKNDRNDLSKAKRVHEASLDKNKVGNKPNLRRNEQRQKEAINKAFSDLKELWYEKGIPECHMQIMTKIFNRENYPMKILEDIKHEFSEVTKQTSLIQKIMSSVESRQACLEKIMEIVQQVEKGELQGAKLNKLFEEKVNHLRILTVHCIECIYQWRQSIEPLVPRNYKLRYVANGRSYFSKIIEDYRSISVSKLGQVYAFDLKKPDVFFLNYTFEGKKMSIVSKSIIKRIRLCEMLLFDDEGEEPQEEESKRTPLIQKVKSPPNRHQDKSMPSKGIVATIQKWKKLEIQYGDFSQYFANTLAHSAFSQSFLNTVELMRYEEVTIFQSTDTAEDIVLAVDKNSSQRKIIILAVRSTIETVENTVKSLCEYLWQHDNCSELRVSLVHHKIGQNLSVDVELQRRLKAVGFRWVSVNHANEMRLTIYSIKRPLNTIAHKTARRKQAYPVVIQHLCLFSLQQTPQKRTNSRCIVSAFALIDLLKQQKKPQYEQLCGRDEFAHHLDCMLKIENYLAEQSKRNGISEGYDRSFTYSGLKAFEIDSEETASKIFRNLEISDKRLPHYYPHYLSLVNSSFKFRHPTIIHEKYTKFLPSKQTEILICESQYPIYLLQSDEEMINFFIIEVQQNFSMAKIDQIFHAMGEESSFLDDFWLPVFHKTLDYVDEVGFRSTEIVSTDYWSCLGSFKRKGNKKRTKIIKPPFVFGIIHKKLLEIQEIPFYCTLVKKEDLV